MSRNRHLELAIEALEQMKGEDWARIQAMRRTTSAEVDLYHERKRAYVERATQIDEAIAWLRGLAQETVCKDHGGCSA